MKRLAHLDQRVARLGALLRSGTGIRQTLRGPLLLAALCLFGIGTWLSVRQLGLSVATFRPEPLLILLLIAPLSLLYAGVALYLLSRSAGGAMPLGKATTTAAWATVAEAFPLPGGALVRAGALVAEGASAGRSSLLVLGTAILWISLACLGCGTTLIAHGFVEGWTLAGVGGLSSGAISLWLVRTAGTRIAIQTLLHRASGLALIAVRLKLAFMALGTALPLADMFPFALANIAGSAASIAPAGLGISELIAALVADSVAAPAAAAFLAVALDRLVCLGASGLMAFATQARSKSGAKHRHLVWGTFDTGKPRVRMMVEAVRLAEPGAPVLHRNPWAGIEDKSQIRGTGRKLVLLLRLLASYPGLIVRYLRAPAHDVVVVPYPGNLDVLILWPLARLRGARICWDMFISLYDTAVVDRALASRKSLTARLLKACEWLSTRAADTVLLDTRSHADYVRTLYALPPGTTRSVWVGTEQAMFRRSPARVPASPLRVLFYGQFIPLHGLDTIIEAAALIRDCSDAPAMTFTIVGTGQEAARIDRLIEQRQLDSIERVAWVDYTRLPALIAASDICLGVFGAGGKAARVIPNKVFQILGVGRPLVTMDGPAIREIVAPGDAVRLVPPGNAAALSDALVDLARELADPVRAAQIHAAIDREMPLVGVAAIRDQFVSAMESA